MIGTRIVLKRGGRDEPEKPFWISFSDLMTALMVLFLVAMSVALLAVTKTITETERAHAERDKEIEELLDQIQKAAQEFEGVSVEKEARTIVFGDKARFDTARHQLTDDKAAQLRRFVPTVLEIARNSLGQKWLKRIVVEGFTDQRGSYLYNLNLSLQRSQRVLCALLGPIGPDEVPMTSDELEQIRELFLVGGYSFNSAKSTLEESRRIEFRLEFYTVDEKPVEKGNIPRGNFGTCALGG